MAVFVSLSPPMVSEHLPSIFAQWSPVNSPGWYHQSYARPSVAENSLLCPLTGRGRPWHGGSVDHSAPGRKAPFFHHQSFSIYSNFLLLAWCLVSSETCYWRFFPAYSCRHLSSVLDLVLRFFS